MTFGHFADDRDTQQTGSDGCSASTRSLILATPKLDSPRPRTQMLTRTRPIENGLCTTGLDCTRSVRLAKILVDSFYDSTPCVSELSIVCTRHQSGGNIRSEQKLGRTNEMVIASLKRILRCDGTILEVNISLCQPSTMSL